TASGTWCESVELARRRCTLAVLEWISGHPLDRSDPRAPEVAGALLGQIHHALQLQGERSWVPAALMEWMAKQAESPSVDEARLGRALEHLQCFANEVALTEGVVYGDPSPEILIGGGRVSIIDWGTPS